MIVCDTGPLVSALNRAEGDRHRLAATLLARAGRDILVPWPVFVEVDLVLRSRGHHAASLTFGRSLLGGVHQLAAPSDAELGMALELAERYGDAGVDLADLSVMAIAASRHAWILTWDYRHFRSVVLRRGHHWDLLVEEAELPEA
jgi:predicted nucleic acid-binding protein